MHKDRLYRTAGSEQEFTNSLIRAIYEASPDGILVVNDQNTIISHNKRFLELWQLPQAEFGVSDTLRGACDDAILAAVVARVKDPDKFLARVRELYRNPDVEDASEIELKDGRTLERYSTVVRTDSGAILGRVWFFKDMTRRIQMEASLRKASEEAEQASRAKSEFLANMSHEIRTPMNGVVGMTELALGTHLTPQQKEYLETAKSSADALLTVVNDILDFSKIEAGKLDLDPIPLVVRATLSRIMKPLQFRTDPKDLKLLCDIHRDVPEHIIADPTRLTQIIGNLIGNAIKFTDYGEIELRVAVDHLQTHHALLHFSVRDTGIGVPEEKRASIFEAFAQADCSTTRKFGGTGLGLAISRRLVELMGGQIWLESHVGQGSCFHFTLQVGLVAKQEPSAEPEVVNASKRINAPAGQELRILLAEDNLINQKVAARMLEKQGHTITIVEDGHQAIQAWESNQFDLILMDVQMPGLDGLKATEEIRRRERSSGLRIPIIALTAHALNGYRDHCLAAGMDGYVTKPIRTEELLREMLRLQPAEPMPQTTK